jgi:hypothetical protein
MPYRVGAKGSFGCSGYPALKEGTNEVMGCHTTRAEAAAQIFAINRSEGKIGKSNTLLEKSMVSEGDFVMFICHDEKIKVGRIEYVMTNPGWLGMEGSEYALEYMEDDKPLIIRLYEEDGGAWEEEEYVVYHRMSEVVKIDSLTVSMEMVMEVGSTDSEVSQPSEETMMAMYDAQMGKAEKPNYEDMLDRPGDSKPSNMDLYNRIKQEARTKFDVYPSAVANAWVVAEYKRRGGTYKYSDSMTTTKSLWGGKFDPRG